MNSVQTLDRFMDYVKQAIDNDISVDPISM